MTAGNGNQDSAITAIPVAAFIGEVNEKHNISMKNVTFTPNWNLGGVVLNYLDGSKGGRSVRHGISPEIAVVDSRERPANEKVAELVDAMPLHRCKRLGANTLSK